MTNYVAVRRYAAGKIMQNILISAQLKWNDPQLVV